MLLLVILISSIGASSDTVGLGKATGTNGTTLTPSPVIRVNGETELSSLISMNQWNGTGTADSPYIMENLSIDAQGVTSAVSISNTTSHLIIRNCLFYGVYSDFYGNGGEVILDNVTSASLENNILVSANGAAISLRSSSRDQVTYNSCQGQNLSTGIVLFHSSNNTISNNDCSNNSEGILLIDSCFQNVLSHNDASKCSFRSILLWGGSGNIIIDNNCSYSGDDFRSDRLEVSDSNNNVIAYNDCTGAGGYFSTGIHLYNSSENTLSANICNSVAVGIWGEATLHSNIITNNRCLGDRIGIGLDSGDGNIIMNNNCTGSREWGIGVQTNNNQISGNAGTVMIYNPSNFDYVSLIVTIFVLLIGVILVYWRVHKKKRPKDREGTR